MSVFTFVTTFGLSIALMVLVLWLGIVDDEDN
jgi:hypothetical protein